MGPAEEPGTITEADRLGPFAGVPAFASPEGPAPPAAALLPLPGTIKLPRAEAATLFGVPRDGGAADDDDDDDDEDDDEDGDGAGAKAEGTCIMLPGAAPLPLASPLCCLRCKLLIGLGSNCTPPLFSEPAPAAGAATAGEAAAAADDDAAEADEDAPHFSFSFRDGRRKLPCGGCSVNPCGMVVATAAFAG